jgi:hypothetical protein
MNPTNPLHGRRRWLHEPLLHFVVIGALLFVVNAVRNDEPAGDDPMRIVLTEDDLLQMAAALRTRRLPDPDTPQFKSLIETKVREEVLYREALAMGLDQNDTIVKRRMVQKMDFLAEDLSALREPTDDELRDWLETHPDEFAYPPRVTFRHLFFGFDERGIQAHAAAVDALEKTAGLAIDAPSVQSLGDAFMFRDYYADRSPEQVAREFGDGFAQALFQLQPGGWAGPVESGFGWHLVYVDSLTPGRVPDFEEVQNAVRQDWMANQRAEFKDEAYRIMREKYQVILPESVTTVRN